MIMRQFLRYLWLACLMTVAVDLTAQTTKWQAIHEVKRKETIFGIARQNGLTIQELIAANPEMNTPGYELQKGAVLNIPYSKADLEAIEAERVAKARKAAEAAEAAKEAADDVRTRVIRLGVMLPLHDINGDGRRMTEYYRGVLMACDSLKKQGLSIDVHAWNTPEDGNINKVLSDPAAAKCDLIIGPLYSKQMDALSDFVTKHNIRLVIPFSINAPQLTTNRNIFQIWQSQTDVSEASITRYVERFKDCHTIVVDCNDSTSRKGIFTSGLRRQMEQRGMEFVITNLRSDETTFSKAFSRTKPNVVVLNTGRSQELGVAISKLNGLKANNLELNITLFGYSDWLLYTNRYLESFYTYNAYIPKVKQPTIQVTIIFPTFPFKA